MEPQIWTTEITHAFQKMKSIMAQNTLIFYLIRNERFHIYTDSGDYQLGPTMIQRDQDGNLRPIAYFSKKVHKAQTNYPTGEKEILSLRDFTII